MSALGFRGDWTGRPERNLSKASGIEGAGRSAETALNEGKDRGVESPKEKAAEPEKSRESVPEPGPAPKQKSAEMDLGL